MALGTAEKLLLSILRTVKPEWVIPVLAEWISQKALSTLKNPNSASYKAAEDALVELAEEIRLKFPHRF